jgi:hypothetical protein
MASEAGTLQGVGRVSLAYGMQASGANFEGERVLHDVMDDLYRSFGTRILGKSIDCIDEISDRLILARGDPVVRDPVQQRIDIGIGNVAPLVQGSQPVGMQLRIGEDTAVNIVPGNLLQDKQQAGNMSYVELLVRGNA